MLYKKKSFSVPATNGNATMCDSAGHSMPDTKGKCIRCGEHVLASKAAALLNAVDAQILATPWVDGR